MQGVNHKKDVVTEYAYIDNFADKEGLENFLELYDFDYLYKSGGGKVGFYRRLSYDQPSPTVVTSPVQKATMMCHPTQNRPLSVKEYARIQQFPDDWVFTGTTAAKYRQIGNAVPVGLAEAIGKTVLSVANNTAVVQTKRFRGTNVHNKIRNAIELGGSLYAVK